LRRKIWRLVDEASEENPKPPRASLPKGWSAEAMDLEKALTLLSLPREIGPHPEDGNMISANFGRFGPYVMHRAEGDAKPTYANLRDPNDVFEIGMNRAVEVLAEKRSRGAGRGRGAAVEPLKALGDHPDKGGAINVMEGRYGPYVKWEKVNATIPKDVKPEDVTMEMAVGLIAEREAKGGKKKTTTRKKTSK
jgi:DNA topoisomerase-1